jgi:hypothetical protein
MNMLFMMKLYAFTRSLEKVLKQLKFFLKNKIILRELKSLMRKQTNQKYGVN